MRNVNTSPQLPADRQPESRQPRQTGGGLGKLIILVIAVSLGLAGYWALGNRLSLEYLAGQEAELRGYRQEAPFLVALIAIAVYVAVAGLSLPGATVLTLACGWYFGFWTGLVIVSFGSTGGATLACLLSRYMLRDGLQEKFAKRLAAVNEALEREGAFYLFTLRLIPAVPFFVINAVMGLTKIRVVTFWWVSQLGMLPGTAAYVYAGASVPSLRGLAKEGVGKILNWQLLLAFGIVGMLPLVVKRLMVLRVHWKN